MSYPPGFAQRLAAQPVGLLVSNEFTILRIEPDLAIQEQGNVSRMAGNMRPAGCIGIGPGQGPGLDTVQEIPHVIFRMQKLNLIRPDLFF